MVAKVAANAPSSPCAGLFSLLPIALPDTRAHGSRLMAYSFSRLPLVLLLELQSIPQPSTLIVCNLLYQLLAGERLVFPDE